MYEDPEVAALFDTKARVQRMLDVEAALARAEAAAGLIPKTAADAIAACCRVELYDMDAFERAARDAGTEAVALVEMLRERVDAGARAWVHHGATSQDIMDTALCLQMRDGIDRIRARLTASGAILAELADRHRGTAMIGRTLLQQAVPITFGLKAARWLGLVSRSALRLDGARGLLAIQLGGAAGTLAELNDGKQRSTSTRVAALLGSELGLAVPDAPWHAERDRIAEIASALGTVAGSMSKISLDLVLLAQNEVGEVRFTPRGSAGRSSAMPHKRNPAEAVAALASARLAIGVVPVVLGAMAQEHERAAGGWQAEHAAMTGLVRYTSGAVGWTARALEVVEVDPDRMRSNLEAAVNDPKARANVGDADALIDGALESYRKVGA